MTDKDKQIKNLLYLNKVLTERIVNAIEEEVMHDRFSKEKLRDSLIYLIDDRINYMNDIGD